MESAGTGSDGKLAEKIKSLSPWFHNIILPDGTHTAPEHPLGDFPAYKWDLMAPLIPQDLTGYRVLDIGCNAGYYSVECAKRGADVTAIDIDEKYLVQAKWVAEIFNVDKRISFHRMQVYDLVKTDWQFDIVLFLGVFYHLRYPLLAIDILSEKATNQVVFQSLTLLVEEEYQAVEDIRLRDRDILLEKGWPSMAFIENKFMKDPTNWWVPNPAAIKAMFRTAGFSFLHSPGQEIFFFQTDRKQPSVVTGWNRSEFLSATGRKWQNEAKMKTGIKNC
jgi:tRNA (mo5U34)-methyltransferase